MAQLPIEKVNIKKVFSDSEDFATDLLAAEEPMEIRIEYGKFGSRLEKSIAVTMRTPGNDFELAVGFLFTEGIIKSYEDILSIRYCQQNGTMSQENICKVAIKENIIIDIPNLERNFYTTSSCGLCGKASIESIKVKGLKKSNTGSENISSQTIYSLVNKIREPQSAFALTGGLHASSLFSYNGDFLFLREDVGRHNALDKLIGYSLYKKLVPLNNCILLLSGRISFELMQKAVMAGINIVVGIGAPSNLAVHLAREYSVTLIGFLKAKSFNIYSGEERVLISAHGKEI